MVKVVTLELLHITDTLTTISQRLTTILEIETVATDDKMDGGNTMVSVL